MHLSPLPLCLSSYLSLLPPYLSLLPPYLSMYLSPLSLCLSVIVLVTVTLYACHHYPCLSLYIVTTGLQHKCWIQGYTVVRGTKTTCGNSSCTNTRSKDIVTGWGDVSSGCWEWTGTFQLVLTCIITEPRIIRLMFWQNVRTIKCAVIWSDIDNI